MEDERENPAQMSKSLFSVVRTLFGPRSGEKLEPTKGSKIEIRWIREGSELLPHRMRPWHGTQSKIQMPLTEDARRLSLLAEARGERRRRRRVRRGGENPLLG